MTTMKSAMRRFFRLLRPMLVLASIVSWASWHAQQARSADSGPKLPVEIPLRMEGGMPVIEVMVNGQGPFLFGLDTGAQGGTVTTSRPRQSSGARRWV